MSSMPLNAKPQPFQPAESVAVSFCAESGRATSLSYGRFKTGLFSLAVLLSGNFAYTPNSIGQDQGGFFGKDFAASPMADIKVNEDSPNPKPARAPLRAREDRPRLNQSERANQPTNVRAPESRESPRVRISEPPAAAIAKSGDAITKLSLIVNSLDRTHFETSIRELVAVSKKRKIPIGMVMHIGDYRAITPTIEAAIRSAGGSITGVSTPPKEYGIETSPSWIMATPTGEIVLEGVRAVGLYIDGNGTFTEKPIVQDRAPEIEVRGEF